MSAIRQIATSAIALQEARSIAERISEVLDGTTEDDSLGRRTGLAPLASGVECRAIQFSYPNVERFVLDDATFRIARGEYVALVGANGAGKSTLAAILSGIHRPQSGSILWDDTPLEECALGAIRSRVVHAGQQVSIFPTSIRENLLLGRNVADDLLWDTITVIGLGEAVRRFPAGLDTVIGGESPHRLSGGERQLLGIARVLLSDAELLILDEPTAALDERRERLVIRALESLKGTRTVMVITHRPAALEPADRILELKGGRIVDHPGSDLERWAMREVQA